jgi:hypothetical protein
LIMTTATPATGLLIGRLCRKKRGVVRKLKLLECAGVVPALLEKAACLRGKHGGIRTHIKNGLRGSRSGSYGRGVVSCGGGGRQLLLRIGL